MSEFNGDIQKWHPSLYGIQFTKAGPIPVEMWNNDMSLTYPEEKTEMYKTLFTWDECKKFISEWYFDRAATIEMMEETDRGEIKNLINEKHFSEHIDNKIDNLTPFDV